MRLDKTVARVGAFETCEVPDPAASLAALAPSARGKSTALAVLLWDGPAPDPVVRTESFPGESPGICR